VPVYGHTESITLSVEFKVTDQNNIPLSGEPTRITFAGEDWQSPDAGERLVTDASGAAQFVVVAEIDKRTKSKNVGMTPFSLPQRTDHLLIAAEFERVVPLEGKDASFHWLLVTHVFCNSGGECSGGYIDEIYAKGSDGRFTRRLEPRLEVLPMASRTDLDSQAVAYGAGYQPSDWLLTRDENDPTRHRWHLKLAYKKLPNPVYR
jgi:hypothetical protein